MSASPKAAPVHLPEQQPSARRNNAIDFLRGLGLWIVLIDHVDANFWSHFTPAQFGFSDFAEIFVFLTGFINAGVYGRALSQSTGRALGKLWKRVLRLYCAHVLAMLTAFGLLYFLASRGLFLNEGVLYTWYRQPGAFLEKTLLLLFNPHWFSLLPLYIVLSPLTVLVTGTLRRWPRATLAFSFLLWVAGQFHFTDSLVVRNQEAWYFHPISWQFMCVLGVAAQVYWGRIAEWANSRLARFSALGIILAAAAWKTGTMIAAVRTWLYVWSPWFTRALAHDAGKARLSILRWVHFLGLLALIAGLQVDWNKLFRARVSRILIATGRNSLLLYCLTLALTPLGNLTLEHYELGIGGQSVLTALGLAGMSLLACARERFTAGRDAKMTSAAPGSTG